MAAPSLTYTLTNGTTADASQVMQNFNDLLNGVTDGTKDLSISALTCAGTATLNGHVNLGNSSADDLTITASLASSLAVKTDGSYDIGGASTGLRYIYLGDGGGDTARIGIASLSADRQYTIPDGGANASFVMTQGAQTVAGVTTYSSGIIFGNSSPSTINKYSTGSFTATFSGASGTVTDTWYYTVIGGCVVVQTGNGTTKAFTKNGSAGVITITGLPTDIVPTTTVRCAPYMLSYNDGGAPSSYPLASCRVTTSGIELFRDQADSGFAAGTQNTILVSTISYVLR